MVEAYSGQDWSYEGFVTLCFGIPGASSKVLSQEGKAVVGLLCCFVNMGIPGIRLCFNVILTTSHLVELKDMRFRVEFWPLLALKYQS